MKKIIFMGTPEYAKKILSALIESKKYEIVAVFTQPDKPVGRKKVLTPPPVKEEALLHDLCVYQPQSLRLPEVIQQIQAIECDFIIVAAYGQILPKPILDHAICINLHASILPAYRGASPIQQALLHGDTKTGVSAMLMDEGLDTGDILKIQQTPIDPNELAPQLYERLSDIAATLTLEVLEEFDTLQPIKQDESLASYCKKIVKEDGKVAFEDATIIYNKYRAFTPWPGIFLENGLKLKKIALKEKEGEYASAKILAIEKESILVGCKKGIIELFNVQPPSKKEMNIIAYINGKRMKVGDYLY